MAIQFRASILASAARTALVGSTFLVTALSATSAQAALVIGSGTMSNVTCAHDVCTATAADALLSLSKLKHMLSHASVTVVSDSQAMDIAVKGSLAWTSANTLTLDSYRAITIDKPVAVQGDGGLTLATNDGGTGGILSFGAKGNVTFLNLADQLTINGHAYTLAGDVATLASDVASNAAGYYALATSYDAGPDGTYDHAPVATPLDGVFEGLGNAISNLTINDGALEDLGLFTSIDTSGTVSDVGLPNISVTGEAGGTLAGDNRGMIRHAYATGTVKDVDASGGLVGGNTGTIEFSHANVAVESGDSPGGLVGNTDGGTIMQSYATGSVHADSLSPGGLVGDNVGGLITQCYSSGAVSGQPSSYVGGLVGVNAGNVTQSYETGTVSGGASGGLMGRNTGTASSTYWDTTTTGLHGRAAGTGDHKRTAGITPLSSGALKAALPAGFDPAVWGLSKTVNSGFPYLLSNPPS